MNQRFTSTCHAHSRAAGIYTAMSAAGIALPFVPSPLDIASCTYADDRAIATPIGQDLPILQDEGAELQSSSDATRRWGLVPIHGNPTADAYTDVPDGTAMQQANGMLPAFPEPNIDDLHAGATHVTLPEYQLVGSGQSLVALVIASLDSSIPLQSGNLVGADYESLSNGAVAMPEMVGGGHAQVVDCYRPMTDAERAQCGSQGKYLFVINGSWGLQCGSTGDGTFLVSEEWIEAGWNYFPLIVR